MCQGEQVSGCQGERVLPRGACSWVLTQQRHLYLAPGASGKKEGGLGPLPPGLIPQTSHGSQSRPLGCGGVRQVTGKAQMLDEIINYVRSLQLQVELLSAKLAALSQVQDEHGAGEREHKGQPQSASPTPCGSGAGAGAESAMGVGGGAALQGAGGQRQRGHPGRPLGRRGHRRGE